MQTVKINNVPNLKKALDAIIQCQGEKFSSWASLVKTIRNRYKLKVDASALRFLHREGLLQISPSLKWKGEKLTDLYVKELALGFFKFKVSTSSMYQTLYGDAVPVFSSNCRIAGPTGAYFDTAEDEIRYLRSLEEKKVLKAPVQQKMEFSDENESPSEEILPDGVHLTLYDNKYVIESSRSGHSIRTEYRTPYTFTDLRTS